MKNKKVEFINLLKDEENVVRLENVNNKEEFITALAEMGISVTDQEADEYIMSFFCFLRP